MSWDSHCDALKASAGGQYVEATIFNPAGQVYAAPGAHYLAELTPEMKGKLISNHDKKTHASFVLPYQGQNIKFMNVQVTDDFSLYTYSGDIGSVQKPVIILARTKTAAVVGMFTKRDANVDNCCKIATNLINNGI